MAYTKVTDSYLSDDASDCSQDAHLLASKEQSSGLEPTQHSFPYTVQHSWWLWLLHALLFTASIGLLIAAKTSSSSSQSCVSRHSSWSPGLDYVDDDYLTVRWNTTYTSPSAFRGLPNPKIDAAWDKYTRLGPMSISEEMVAKINASKTSVVLPPESGGGYMAIPEFVHQLHCVNVLRKHTYPDYYVKEYNRTQTHPSAWHEHADHCTEILRQKLMCDADVTLMTYSWLRRHRLPNPNFNVQHKCRNLDSVYDWAFQNQADAPAGGDIVRPNDRPYHEFEEAPFDLDDMGVVVFPQD